jgi:NTP pyrophosphatase (non-canonical NTP hydrolase)
MEHPMTFGDFQVEAARTGGTDLQPDRQMQGLVCAALGLAGEAAEVLSGALFPNTTRGNDFAQEVGDVLWYAAHLCNVLGWRLSGVTAPDTANGVPTSRRWDTIRDFHDDHCLASRSLGNESTSGTMVSYAARVVVCAGGIADAVKKAACHGQPLEAHLPAINRDLNSLMVNLVLTCEAAGVRLDGPARLNVEKMRKRYPDGFTAEASAARRDEIVQ